MRPYDLKDYEILTALRFFCYYMPLEQRRQLMTEFPVIYNKLMESEIMTAVSKERLTALQKLATSLPDHNGNVPSNAELSALNDRICDGEEGEYRC